LSMSGSKTVRSSPVWSRPGLRRVDMTEQAHDPDVYWHSPARAWTPLMWIIGVVALALVTMLLAPLAPLVVSAAASAPVAYTADADTTTAPH
jgi:hypothetical protein